MSANTFITDFPPVTFIFPVYESIMGDTDHGGQTTGKYASRKITFSLGELIQDKKSSNSEHNEN